MTLLKFILTEIYNINSILIEKMPLLAKKTVSYLLIFSLMSSNFAWAHKDGIYIEDEELYTSHMRLLGDGRVAVIDPGTIRDDGTVHNVFEDLQTGPDGRLIFTAPPQTRQLYTRIFNETEEGVTLSGLIESDASVPMIIGNAGMLVLEGAEFKGIPSLTLGAGALRQTNEGMVYDVEEGVLSIQNTLFAPQEDVGRLFLTGGMVDVAFSNISPSEMISISAGKQYYGLTPPSDDESDEEVSVEKGFSPKSMDEDSGDNAVLSSTKEACASSTGPSEPPHALHIDGRSTLRSRSIFLESLDEGADIRSAGFIHSTDEDIHIYAKGNVYLDHIFSNRNLFIQTTGKVIFGNDVFVGGYTRVTAGGIELQSWQSGGALELESSQGIAIKGPVTSASHISLLAEDDIYIEAPVTSNSSLTVLSNGKIAQGRGGNLSAKKSIYVEGSQVQLNGHSIESDGPLKVVAEEHIKIGTENNLTIFESAEFESQNGFIINQARRIGPPPADMSSTFSLTFKARETRNYGELDLRGPLHIEGDFINTEYGSIVARSLDDLPCFSSLLSKNQGRVHIEDDLSFTENLAVQGALSTGGVIHFDGEDLTIEKRASLEALKGSNFRRGTLTNKGSLIVSGEGLTGYLESVINETRAKMTLSCLSAEITQLINKKSGLIDVKSSINLRGQDFTNEGKLLMRAPGQLDLTGSYVDEGVVYCSSLFMLNASSIHFGGGHKSYLTDALIRGGDVGVDSGAHFHFERTQYFFEIDSKSSIYFNGKFSHDSQEQTFYKRYFHLLNKANLKPNDLKELRNHINFLPPQVREWNRIKNRLTSKQGASKLILRATGDLNCHGAELSPENGQVVLVSDGDIHTDGATIKSGHFRGDSLTARAKNIVLTESELDSLMGSVLVSAEDIAELNLSSVHGGAHVRIDGREVRSTSDRIESSYSHAELVGHEYANIEGSLISAPEGGFIRSKRKADVKNSDVSGSQNEIEAPELTVENLRSFGNTVLSGNKLKLKDLGIEGSASASGEMIDLQGKITGESFVATGDEITNEACIELTNRLTLTGNILRQLKKTRAAHIFLKATETYDDAVDSVNEALETFTLMAQKTEGFQGTQIAGQTAKIVLRKMNLYELLSKVQARTIEAILKEEDVVLEKNFHLVSNLSLVAKSFTNKSHLTGEGFFKGAFAERLDNFGSFDIDRDVLQRASQGMTAGKMRSGQALALQSDGELTLTSLVEGESVDLSARGLKCERGVRRVYYPGGYRDVLEDPVGAIARHGNLTVAGSEWLKARAATFYAKGGYTSLSSPDLYVGSQVTHEDYTQSQKDYYFHSHSATHHMSDVRGDNGVLFMAESTPFQKYAPRIVLEGLTVDSGADTVVYSEGTIENRTVHDTYEAESESRDDGGLFGGESVEKTKVATSTVRPNLFVSTGDVRMISQGDSHHWALNIETDGKAQVRSEKGKVYLHADKSTSFSSTEKSSESLVWQSQSQSGHYHETGVVGRILAKGGVDIWGHGGIEVDFVGSDLESALQRYSRDPATAWMTILRSQPNVNWRQIEEKHEEWHQSTSGLTGAATIVISLAVAIATSGVGASIMGLTGAAGSMASAGFSCLASQAAVSLINNKGDIGRTLQDLGSRESIKSLAISVVSAGAIHGLSNYFDLPAKAATFTEHLQDNLVRSGVSAGLSVVANPERAGEILVQAARGVVAGALGGTLANEIGARWWSGEMHTITHKVAHGVLGAAMGVLVSDDPASGAIAGAIGGIVSECVVEMLEEDDLQVRVLQEQKERVVAEGRPLTQEAYTQALREAVRQKANIGKVVAAVTSLVADQDVGVTVQTAKNAVENNFLPVAVLIAVNGGLLLYAAYDIVETYRKEGVKAALIKAGIEITLAVTGGVILKAGGKAALKIGDIAAPTLEAAWSKLISKHPLLFKAAEKISGGLGRIASSGARGTTEGIKSRYVRPASLKDEILSAQRVGSALKNDIVKPLNDARGRIIREFPTESKGHGFPNIVDNFVRDAVRFNLKGGARLYQIEGSQAGKLGRFEWIVEGGKVTHRQFIRGGKVNGVPIKK